MYVDVYIAHHMCIHAHMHTLSSTRTCLEVPGWALGFHIKARTLSRGDPSPLSEHPNLPFVHKPVAPFSEPQHCSLALAALGWKPGFHEETPVSGPGDCTPQQQQLGLCQASGML